MLTHKKAGILPLPQTKKIPYINVNLPNDAGITDNPYFVMMNSTLQTHIDHLYKYLQKNYALSPIIIFRKKGQMEDIVRSFFDSAEKIPCLFH